jgi:hypothetical protein
MAAHDVILEHRVDQMFHANRKRRESEIYAVDDRVYLSMQNLTLPKGTARKLVPWYIGPYRVIEAHNKASTVTLELPDDLKNRRVSPTFHTNLVRRYIANNDDLFPKREAKSFYDFGVTADGEWLVDEIIAHRRINSKELEFQVRWTLGVRATLVHCGDHTITQASRGEIQSMHKQQGVQAKRESHLGEGKSKEKSLRIPTTSEPVLYTP